MGHVSVSPSSVRLSDSRDTVYPSGTAVDKDICATYPFFAKQWQSQGEQVSAGRNFISGLQEQRSNKTKL